MASKFFTGIPCKNGHIAERYISVGRCVECVKNRGDKYASSNRDLLSGKSRKYHQDNKDVVNDKRRKREQHYKQVLGEGGYKEKRAKQYSDKKHIYSEMYKKYRDENKEKVIAAIKRWQLKNKDKLNQYSRNRKAIKKNAIGKHSTEDVKKLLIAQKSNCIYCKKDITNNFHVDHIFPLSKGGGNGPENIQLLCKSCNLSKHAKLPEVFAKERGLLL